MGRIILCVMAIGLFASTVFGGEYQSKSFPPLSSINKSMYKWIARSNYEIPRLVGKNKVSNAEYTAYLLFQHRRGSVPDTTEEVKLISLDNGLWILKWKEYTDIVQE